MIKRRKKIKQNSKQIQSIQQKHEDHNIRISSKQRIEEFFFFFIFS